MPVHCKKLDSASTALVQSVMTRMLTDDDADDDDDDDDDHHHHDHDGDDDGEALPI